MYTPQIANGTVAFATGGVDVKVGFTPKQITFSNDDVTATVVLGGDVDLETGTAMTGTKIVAAGTQTALTAVTATEFGFSLAAEADLFVDGETVTYFVVG